MEVIFLGTASNNPTPTRNVSCTCFRIDGDVWLFDSGEATQIQLMKSTIKAGKITRIFITHLHGDHIFGLPGLMCTIGQNIVENKKLEIYGPVGLRRYLRTCLELSRSMVTYNYIVHELVSINDQIPDEIKNWRIIESDDQYLHPSESLGNQIEINENGYWALFDNEQLSVKAVWLRHKVPTFGYIIETKPQQGKLDVEALKKLGIQPGPIYKKIKLGENVTLEDGTVIEASKFIGASKSSKKITYLGDCYDVPSQTVLIAQNSDLLIHEATLEDNLKEKAISNGHSTPSMAANVANSMNAKQLILNHFSQRYKPLDYVKSHGNDSKIDHEKDEEVETVQILLDQANQVFKHKNVIAAQDFFVFRV